MIGITDRLLLWLYRVGVGVAIFTGFGNMPLYGRYYVGNVPGFGWSSNFMVNVQVHYVAGAVLVALAVYAAIVYTGLRVRGLRLTTSGVLRVVFLVLALLSGLVMAVKNLPGVSVDFPMMPVLNFFHLFASMIFMFFSLGCVITRARWINSSSPD
ncbi:MAG: hypothetical protein SWC96_01020 [Thermodesulfobacteriota bacterium]|uniref:FeS-binding protein n=1 Tax=Desulfosudis oleivorans (strain DSM 6200 / JCM 39069 / Hxd3) TaxID=96561 RepID=A8ZS93_DESOH|nr:hypothetical protein [Desulfosudis oleivorans]ABW66111.1 hypothetical protein Dole_0301 [Desulfosudis oleivorans Hxd3]MDY6830420.1 hypothetical protein [Thermodesulfobacteriota bacterium]